MELCFLFPTNDMEFRFLFPTHDPFFRWDHKSEDV